MTRESDIQRLRFAWVATAACLALTLPRLLTHELWRDEAWLWLVVTDSTSSSDLFSRLGRTGQGYLFPWLCLLAKNASTSPRAMQVLHLVLTGAGAFTFARWAPFRRLERALFIFGYFPFYEYAVISRHYVVGALLLWIACVLVRAGRPVPALGLAVALLCQTTVYGFILALAVVGGWLVDRFLRRRELPPLRPVEVATGLALAVPGAVAGVVQLVPDAGTVFASEWRFGWSAHVAVRVSQAPWHAFVPVPRAGLHFWNSNALDALPLLQALLGVAVFVGAVAFLRPRPAGLATFLLGAFGLATFGYIKLAGELRHDGHWWLLFAAALWIGGGIPAAANSGAWRDRAFLTLLALHGATAAYASWMDLRHPFSNAEATARLLRAEGLDREPLLGYREPPAAPVALALDRDLFFPSRGVLARYPDWGPGQRELREAELRCAARAFAANQGRDVILVMNRELLGWRELSDAGSVVGAILPTEDYHLYRMRWALLRETAPEAACSEAPRTP